MPLERYLAKSRIIEIQSDDLNGALEELLKVATKRLSARLSPNRLLNDFLNRESIMTTYLGNGVAIPHLRVKMKRSFVFAIGRCREGFKYDGVPKGTEVRILLLLLASDKVKNYLSVLASLARLFREKTLIDNILGAPNLEIFQERVIQGFSGLPVRPGRRQSRFNRLLLKEGEKVAKAARCSAILIFSDTFDGGIDLSPDFPKYRTVMVTRSAPERLQEQNNNTTMIEVKPYSNHRLSQLRSAVLIGLTRGIFKYNDRLCCVAGILNSNQFDTLVVVDVEREFQSVLTREADLLPSSVSFEVLERILAIATDLSLEGREGRSIGCLFVLGDTKKVNTMIKPLVLNPFHGYKEEDRNVLNPFMDETIKELSFMDGAFIIKGNGIIESAGSLINTPSDYYHEIPSGFGARHAAASAISRATDSIVIAVSATSGRVTLFRRGVMLPLIDNSMGGVQ